MKRTELNSEKMKIGIEPQRQRLSQCVVSERPIHQRDAGRDLERRFEQVDGPLATVEAPDRVEHVEMQEAQERARDHVGVEQHEVRGAAPAHRERIGVARRAVVPMMLQVILAECDKRHADRNHRDDAERGIEPATAEKRVVSGIVHERDDAHPEVAERHVARPFDDCGARRPRQRSRRPHQAEKQRNLDEVGPDAHGGQAHEVGATQSRQVEGVQKRSR